jgi:hypothetical protein
MKTSSTFLAFFAFALCSLAATLSAADEPMRFKGEPHLPGNGKHIVLVSGDEEYRSEEALVQLGKILAQRHGFDCTVLFAIDPKTGKIDPVCTTNIPHLDSLKTADVMIVNLRFRNLPDEQMQYIDDYLQSGKPVLGMRTATHAFSIPKDRKFARYSFNYKDSSGDWTQGFGRKILGETWINHHGHHAVEATRGTIAPEAKNNPIVQGCGDIFGPTDVYTVRLPLPGDSQPLVLGLVLEGMKPDDKPVAGAKNNPPLPVAWTKSYTMESGKSGKVFTTTMGSAEDLNSEGLRRLLVNAVYYLAGMESKIPEKTNVDIVGEYHPSPMGWYTKVKGGGVSIVLPVNAPSATVSAARRFGQRSK